MLPEQSNTGILHLFALYAKVYILFVDKFDKINCSALHVINVAVLCYIIFPYIENKLRLHLGCTMALFEMYTSSITTSFTEG